MSKLKLFEQYKEHSKIEEWLTEHSIEDYTINDDNTVDVDGNVDLSEKNLVEIPIQFGKVDGGFYCYNNKLTSLKGCPKEVGGSFNCSYNQLTSFEGCPSAIDYDFSFKFNEIVSLEGLEKFSVPGTLYYLNNPIYYLLRDDLMKLAIKNIQSFIDSNVIMIDKNDKAIFNYQRYLNFLRYNKLENNYDKDFFIKNNEELGGLYQID